MSEVETALTGADAAPVPEETDKPVEGQENPQVSADADSDASKDDQPRDDKGKFVQKRINELTREKHEARRQAEQYQQRLQQVEQELARSRQYAVPDPNVDLDGYIRHIAEQRADEIVQSDRSQWQQQQHQQHIQSLAQTYQSRADEYAAKNPGYVDAEGAFVSIAGANPLVAEVLMTSDHGPAVVDYLGNHLDEASRILSMPPHLAAAALARIEVRVSTQKQKPVTSAPNPPPTLGGGKATVAKNPDDMSQAEWLAWRSSSLKK